MEVNRVFWYNISKQKCLPKYLYFKPYPARVMRVVRFRTWQHAGQTRAPHILSHFSDVKIKHPPENLTEFCRYILLTTL